MKHLFSILLAVMMNSAFLAADPASKNDAAKGAAHALQGTWYAFVAEHKKVGGGLGKGTLIFAGNQVNLDVKPVFPDGMGSIPQLTLKAKGTFRLHPEHDPPRIDLTLAGQAHKGIYRLRGHRMDIRLAPAEGNAPYPKNFNFENKHVAGMRLELQRKLSGRQLPREAEVTKMTVIRKPKRGNRQEIVVSTANLGKILDALGPETQDPLPYKWKTLGYDLRLSLKGGREIQIWLFRGSKGRVAFAMGPSWEERIYYLGGPLNGITNALDQALREGKKGKQ